jgi:hypothetical protein
VTAGKTAYILKDNNMKRSEVLIKFKSMEEILMTESAWFDGHGNLCVQGIFQKEHLAPNYFSKLGKLKKVPFGHSYPSWAIEAEYDDIFYPNMALRKIASGKYSPERNVELAKEAVIVPEKDENNV